MTKPFPQIQMYMTTNPKFVEKYQSLIEAANLMKEENFRHLPVLNNGEITGILSMTDINLTHTLKCPEISKMKVADAYTPNPMTFSPDACVDEVCRCMALNKIGCVLIEDNNQLVGIFSWMDALRVMTDLLQAKMK